MWTQFISLSLVQQTAERGHSLSFYHLYRKQLSLVTVYHLYGKQLNVDTVYQFIN